MTRPTAYWLVVASRWPGWVYDEGDEPDPRFSLANERTFLAWVRTSLALLAGGVALQALPVVMHPMTRRVLAAVLVVLSLGCVATGWLRWARTERAMRSGQPLPGAVLTAVLGGAVVVVGLVLLFVVSV